MTAIRSTASVSGVGTSVVLTDPAGRIADDGLYALIVHDPNTQIVLPLGWTISDSWFGSTTTRLMRYIGSNAGPWTVEFLSSDLPVSNKYAAATVALSRSVTAGATGPVLDVTAHVFVDSATAVTAPAVTPTADGDVVLTVVAWQRGTTFTTPAGVTERVDVRSGDGSTDRTLWVGSEDIAGGAGVPIPARTVTNDNPFGFTSAQHLAVTLAFKSTPPADTWAGDFETGDLTQYPIVLREAEDRIEIRTDSPYQGTSYARFTALDTDHPASPNPRAQLNRPGLLYAGFTRWISWATRFPEDFPEIPADGWFVFAQVHGPPYNDSPQIGIDVGPGDRITFDRNSQYDYDTVWETPMIRGEWLDFALRVNFARDETGWVELYYQGEQQTFVDGSRRLYMQTVQTDQTNDVEWVPTLYRKRGMFESVTLDHDGHRIDTDIPASLLNAVNVRPTAIVRSAGGGRYARIAG